VDLDNEVIVDKTEDHDQSDDLDEEEAAQSKHPVLLNQYPLCEGHSLFLLFAQEGLP